MNTVTVSEDGMWMTIRNEDGRKATLRSARDNGFAADDIEYAHTYEFPSTMQEGQVDRMRKLRLGRHSLYLIANTGPPTWWVPKLDIRRDRVVVGWLRLLVGVMWE